MPNLYIIAGPNGAGKTTFARAFLPHYAACEEFVNADLIAAGLSPFIPERAAFQAGRLMLEQIQALNQRRCDFGFETTLSGRTYLPLLQNMRRQGYAIHLFFLWLQDVELAIARVADRVHKGGHSVPEAIIRRRFDKGLRNLLHYYRPCLDSWILFDNSTDVPHRVAEEKDGELRVIDPNLYAVMPAKVRNVS